MEENNSWIETISSPWRETLVAALKKVQQKLFIVSPYIKEAIVQQIREAILQRESSLPLEIHVITRSLPEEFISGSSDIEALQHIYQWSKDIKNCYTEIRSINNVHAKIWIVDNQVAIVGSGNATPSGLDTNVEYELAVTHPDTIEKIQQDWQPLWEYAEPITGIQLTAMAEWVRQIHTASALLEQETKEKRQAIEKEIGKAPKVGKRYAVKRSAKQVGNKLSSESSSTPQYQKPSMQTTKRVEETPSLFDELQDSILPAETIHAISIAQFWQALIWVFPRTEDWTTDPSPTDALFLKISWISQPTTQYLQLNWADGKRLSQVTIPGQSMDTTQSWSISIHFQYIAQLVEALRKIQTSQNKFQASTKEINLLQIKEGHKQQLYISKPDRPFTMQTPVLTGTRTNIPLPFSTLKQPVSSIIIEHSQLIATLHQLEQQWYSLHEERENSASKYGPYIVLDKNNYRPTTLNIRLDTPGEISSIHFLLEASDIRSEIDLPSTHCVLAGHTIVITLSYKAFWQALIGSQNAISTWQLCIDANMDSLQLIPEPTKDTMLATWRHELRHIEE